MIIHQMKTMHLYPQPTERYGTKIKRSCQIERRNGDKLENSQILWYEFPEIEHLPVEEDAETYLLATIMQAMWEERTLIVHGTVSHELLANLTEYRNAWCCWLPQYYHPIDFYVDNVTEEYEKKEGSVCAFSGGVDATFSVWQHTQKKHGYRSQKINFCTMVHGFDIPVEDEKAFASSFEQAAATLKSLNLSLLPIRTNFRRVVQTKWEDVFAIALVAALHHFKGIAGTAIIGSSEPYNSLVLPWGSNPITDHLLSGGGLIVMHDGAAYDRTRKVSAISQWKEGCENLRVCWEGELKDRNCGRCEKCLRTMLNFRANNLSIPECFQDMEISSEKIYKVRLSNVAVFAEWTQILKAAASHSIQDKWVIILDSKLKRERLINIVFSKGSTQSKWIHRIITVSKKTSSFIKSFTS